MRLLDRHIEYLLRRNDCVVIPGVGAFLCQYYTARFDESERSILPPGRRLAFNRWLTDDDGLLVSSVARAEGVSTAEASSMIKEEADSLLEFLSSGTNVRLGRLGEFTPVSSDNGYDFVCNDGVPGINGPLFGLQPVVPSSLIVTASDQSSVVSEVGLNSIPDVTEKSRRLLWFPPQWRAYASGIVAALAVFFTLAFFILSPIQVDKNTRSASIAPINSAQTLDTESIESENPKPVEGEYVSGSVSEDVSDIVDMSDNDTDEIGEISADSELSENGQLSDDQSSNGVKDNTSEVSIRLDQNDPYIVVVASFPTIELAQMYVHDNSNTNLGIEHMNGRYRVYAATGNDYSTASAMMNLIDQSDAWICKK